MSVVPKASADVKRWLVTTLATDIGRLGVDFGKDTLYFKHNRFRRKQRDKDEMGVKKRVVRLSRHMAELFAVLVLVLSGTFLPLAKVFASGTTTINAPSTLAGQPGQSVAVSGVSITATGNPTEPVHIGVQHGSVSMSVTTGLTFTTPTSSPYTGSVLEFSGSLTNVNAALATLHYSADSLSTDSLDITLTNPGEVYNPGNGHLYQYVDTPGGISWTDAKTAADASTEDGLTGYLATLTTSAENAFVGARVQHDAWIGASDLAVDGDWKWVDGPETGTSFWSEPAPAAGGNTVNGGYANWSSGEPNDGQGNGREDCAEYYSNQLNPGFWNDLPCDDDAMTGYLVEYGSNGNLPTVINKSIAVTNTGATVTPTDCTQLMALDDNPGSQYDAITLSGDIDCTNLSVAPLFSDYNTFPSGFQGVLNGQGHSITGYDLSYSDSYAGLFAKTDGATIENLNLTNGSITNNDDETGAVVGYAEATTIDHVTSSWNISSSEYEEGGLVGYLYNDSAESSAITHSSVTGNVTDGEDEIGGLVGYVENEGGTLTISQDYVTGNVDGSDAEDIGGLIGEIENYAESDHDGSTIIEDVYVTGNIGDETNAYYVGGLIGELDNDGDNPHTAPLTIERGYVSGSVHAYDYVGGVVGYVDYAEQYSPLSFNDLFVAGNISGTNAADMGALIGYSDGEQNYVTSTDNYVDQTATGLTNCVGSSGNPITGSCTGIDTAAQPNYFKGNHSRAPMNTWDFAAIWRANGSAYPTFGAGDDSDGVSQTVENAAPNGGDANGDGQDDSVQANVTSLVDATTGKYAVLESSGCADNRAVSVGSEAANAKQDSSYSYPLGLLNFTLICAHPGDTATVTQYYYGNYDASNYVLRKYDATTSNYQTIPGAVLSTVTIGGQSALKAVYSITDGSALDEDGTANGHIVDPAGPALANAAGSAAATSAGGSLVDTGLNILAISALSAALIASALFLYRRSGQTGQNGTTTK